MKKIFLVFCVVLFCGVPNSAAYTARFGWENPSATPIDAILARVARTRKDIELGGEGTLFLEVSLPPGTTSCDVEVVPELYGGYYLSITLVIAGEEGPPVIIDEKPGNVVGTSCDLIPPLGFKAAVTNLDVSRLMWYLRYLPLVPSPNPDYPAGEQERCDFSGDGKITSIDYSFLIYISRNYPYMGDRPAW